MDRQGGFHYFSGMTSSSVNHLFAARVALPPSLRAEEEQEEGTGDSDTEQTVFPVQGEVYIDEEDVHRYVHDCAPEGLNRLFLSLDDVIEAVRIFSSRLLKSLVLGRSTTDVKGTKNTQQFECCYSGKPKGPKSKKCGCKYFMWFGRFSARLRDGAVAKLWRLNSIHNSHSCPDVSAEEYRLTRHQRYIPDDVKRIVADVVVESDASMAKVQEAVFAALPVYLDASQRTWIDEDMRNLVKKCRRVLVDKTEVHGLLKLNKEATAAPMPSSAVTAAARSHMSILEKWKACLDLASSSDQAQRLLAKLDVIAEEAFNLILSESRHRGVDADTDGIDALASDADDSEQSVSCRLKRKAVSSLFAEDDKPTSQLFPHQPHKVKVKSAAAVKRRR